MTITIKKTRMMLASAALVLPLVIGTPALAQVYQISMPLGGTSGTFYTEGASLAEYINGKTSKLRIVPSTSGGSVENIRLVGSGQAQFGMAFAGHIYGAWTGKAGFERPYIEYRQIGPAQKTSGWNFVVLASSKINSVNDLKGKHFVSGAPGSGSASDADLFMKHIGVWKDIDIGYYAWGELGRMLKDGDIDGFNRTGGAPAGFAQEIDATHPIRVLDLEPQIDASAFLKSYPFFRKVKIPAGTYRGQKNDAVTYGQDVQWIVHKDVPDAVVREFLELAYSDGAIAQLDRTFKDHDHRNKNWLATLYVPIHPAAAAFWAERGVKVPKPLQN